MEDAYKGGGDQEEEGEGEEGGGGEEEEEARRSADAGEGEEPCLPCGVTVYVRCDSTSEAVYGARCITCFRCGEYGHYRGECHSFRVHLCSQHRMGRCSNSHCSFAHGVSELRKPWMAKCVRVVKVAGRVEVLGCGAFGHTYRSCPHFA